jgi:hypothetical protein
MGRIRGSSPSPAMVVAIVALVFAVAGSALAGVATVSVLSKKEKKQTRRIAKDEINKAAPGLSVAHANTANSATTANSAGNSNTLDGLDSTAFLRVVTAATTNEDPGLLANGNCQTRFHIGGAFSGVQPGDVALLFPFGTSFLVPEGFRQPTAGQVSFALCNFTGAALDQAALDFRVIVLR